MRQQLNPLFLFAATASAAVYVATLLAVSGATVAILHACGWTVTARGLLSDPAAGTVIVGWAGIGIFTLAVVGRLIGARQKL